MKKIMIKTALVIIIVSGFVLGGILNSPAIGSVPDLTIEKVFAADLNHSAIASNDQRVGSNSIFSWSTILTFGFVIFAIVSFRRDTEY